MAYIHSNEKKPEWVIFDIQQLKENSQINIRIEEAKHQKEMEVLNLMERKVEAADSYCKRLESENERLNEMLASLADFMRENFMGEQEDGEDVVDTAIRLMKLYKDKGEEQ